MKKVLLIICISLSLLLSGCSKLVKEEVKRIEATIADVVHKEATIQTLPSLTTIGYPEEWITYLEYEDKQYKFKGREIYDKYKEQVGNEVTCDMLIKYYESGGVYKFILNVY